MSQNERGGMGVILIACCAIGVITVGATLTLGRGSLGIGSQTPLPRTCPPSRPKNMANDCSRRRRSCSAPMLPTRKCATRAAISPAAPAIWVLEPSPGTLTLLMATEHYPRFSARVAATTTIEDRVNECMQRSMNGRPLPRNSPEMIAMASYIRSLGAREEAMGASQRKAARAARRSRFPRARLAQTPAGTFSKSAVKCATAAMARVCWQPRIRSMAMCSRPCGDQTVLTTELECTAS